MPYLGLDVFQSKEVKKAITWALKLQKGMITIPKSSNKNRIAENANLFDFELSKEGMTAINNLDRNQRIGPDPNNFNF